MFYCFCMCDAGVDMAFQNLHDMFYCSCLFDAGVDMAFQNLHDMFYFKVELNYVYNVTLVQSRTMKEVHADIEAEIRRRVKPVHVLVSVSGAISVFLLFKVLLK